MSAPTTISRLLLVDDHRAVLRQVAQLLSGAFLAADLDAMVYAAFYQAPWDVLGGDIAFGVAVPYVWLEVEARAQRIAPDGTPDRRLPHGTPPTALPT